MQMKRLGETRMLEIINVNCNTIDSQPYQSLAPEFEKKKKKKKRKNKEKIRINELIDLSALTFDSDRDLVLPYSLR